MKTLFSEDTEAHVVAADLIEHCDDLLAKVDRARAFAGASAAVDDAMAVMREAAGQVRQAFQALC
jgi:hypothetical protein